MDFTVITPSYGYGHYIGDCLKSVAAQDGVRLEHLVMDAGSKDNTADVVKNFPHASFHQEPDKGMSDGINKGFRRARGKWVMWLNADDRLKPGALRALKDYAEAHPDADVIYGCWDFIDEKGDFLRRMTLLPFDRRILVQQGCYIGSTACFYKRETTIGEGHYLDIDFGYCMDGEYYARLAHLGKRFDYFPHVLADFRLHGESISQSSLGKSDMKNVLRMQRQAAEPRAVRRMYGIRLFSDENLNLAADGILYHIYRFKKGLLKTLYARRTSSDGSAR
ncbi:MAG: glycosyltransferase family 2 protein [Verrucomicrobiota bacterium]